MLKETRAPSGYALDRTEHVINADDFSRVYWGTIRHTATIEVENNPSKPPKTGDTFNLILWMGILGILFVGLTSSIIVNVRKKKNNK